MRKIKLEIELYNNTEIALELEHASQLVTKGYTNGRGWSITGKEEKEQREDDEYSDDDNSKRSAGDEDDPQLEVDRENFKKIID